MKVYFREVRVSSTGRKELIDVTHDIAGIVRGSGVTDGICLVHSMHSTSAIIINEHEGGLLNDLASKVRSEFPEDQDWQHNRIDDNADAHLAGSFIGPSVTVPVRGGSLVLGTWQRVFFFELDGPRSDRRIVVEVLGE